MNLHSRTSDRFLEVEREAIQETVGLASKDGVRFDFSMATLPDCLKWMVRQIRISWEPLPADVPEWIRPAHPRGMKVFDDHSKTVLLRAGLYLGECFARLPGFRWTTGNVEYMQMHMPVVAGFRNAEDLRRVESAGRP